MGVWHGERASGIGRGYGLSQSSRRSGRSGVAGGGALGAYQAGVYQALYEAGIEPDWIVGTSIGAINASLIAGNEPARRLDALREFWSRVECRQLWNRLPGWPGVPDTLSYWSILLGGVSGFFRPNPAAFWGAHVPLGVDQAGFYSTAPLRETLTELVDFSLVNRCRPRLTVGAAHVRTSMMHYFDSCDQPISVDHILASGALPPAFPAVRIDGELYWDGGIMSNTPTEVIFEDNPRRSSLIFAVHVWNPEGPEPRTIGEVLHRQKDIQYSSRIAGQVAKLKQAHKLRHVITELAQAPAGGARQPGGARARELRLRVAHACRAAAGAPARQRESHQGCRFQPVRNPHAPRGGLQGHYACPQRRGLARRVRSAGRDDPASSDVGSADGGGVIAKGAKPQ
jgi:NTE family protein